jgi:glycerate kinase
VTGKVVFTNKKEGNI